MQPHIAGKGWKVFVDAELDRWDWTCRGEKYGGEGWEQAFTVTRMLNDHFSREDIEQHWASQTVYGRPYGMLYPIAAEFLNTWGIKCEVAGLPPVQFEAPAPD